MALTSLAEHIAEAQLANGARGYINPFIFPQQSTPALAPSDPDEATARQLDMMPEKLRKLRLWVQQTNKECDESLAREMVVVYKLNDQRTLMTYVGYMSKGEAVEATGWPCGGDFLDLDDLYGGMFVRADHFVIADTKVADGLRRHSSDISAGQLFSRLIKERNSELKVAA